MADQLDQFSTPKYGEDCLFEQLPNRNGAVLVLYIYALLVFHGPGREILDPRAWEDSFLNSILKLGSWSP